MLQQLPLIALALAGLVLVGRFLIHTLEKVLQPMSDALNRLTTSVGGLIDATTGLTTQVETNDTELKAIADALRAGTPNDDAALTALADRLDSARTSVNTATDTAKTAAADAATALPPAGGGGGEVVVTVSPTSITGTSGGDPVTGQFTGDGGSEPYSFAGTSDDLTGLTVEPDGTYSIDGASPQTGTITVVGTDANGIASAPTSVSVSIS